MKCREKLFKLSALFLLASAAIGFSTTGTDSAVTHQELRDDSLSCHFYDTQIDPPSAVFNFPDERQIAADPLARLFQVMFILFFISPPIIAFLLFLIWRELKARNKLK